VGKKKGGLGQKRRNPKEGARKKSHDDKDNAQAQIKHPSFVRNEL